MPCEPSETGVEWTPDCRTGGLGDYGIRTGIALKIAARGEE
jgi:hypothetical protein